MLLSALAEMLTLGAVVPFLALLADPTVVKKNPLLQFLSYWFGAEDSNILLTAGIIFCMIAISAAFIRMIMMWSSMRFSYGLGADIGSEVYRHTLHQHYSWHISQNSSEILAGIDKVNIVVGEILTPIMQGVVAFVIVIGILLMLIGIDWEIALIAGGGFTAMYAINTLVLGSKVKRNSQIISQNMSQRVKAVQEGLGGIRDILIDGTQHVYLHRFIKYDYAMRRAQTSNAVIGASPRYIIEAAGMVLIVALAYWLNPRQGGLSGAIPVLGALAIGAQKLLPQMQLVYASWSSINGSRNQLADVMTYLNKPKSCQNYKENPKNKIKEEDCNKNIQEHANGSKKPLITLNNISFNYGVNSEQVLQNICLEIQQGSKVGFIGKTGSGKSTLMDIIMGLLQPTSGNIEIFNKELDEKNLRNWQTRIAHVPQTIYLSDTTIAENIAFGVPLEKIDFDRVKEASVKAEIADFIETLNLGYKTYIGERGVRLSGGQRQRIGLARALYKNADVLILDEATSALDNETEKTIMLAIHGLGEKYTVIMIAHRLSTLNICDEIIEIKNGLIANKCNINAKLKDTC